MAFITGVRIDPDGTTSKVKLNNTDFREYQAVVGGFFQGLFSPIATIYVNEEGLILNLPFNGEASLFHHRFFGGDGMTRLHGTALIVGPADTQGNDTTARKSVLAYYNLED